MISEILALMLYVLSWFIILSITFKFCGNIINNLPFIFVLLILLLYDFITPAYGLLYGWTSLFGNDVSEWFTKGIFITNISLLSISFGYLICASKFGFQVDNSWRWTKNRVSEKYARAVLIISFSAVILWAKLSGYGVSTLFMTNLIFGTNSKLTVTDYDSYNYLKQVFEFSIPGLILIYASNVSRNEKVFWFTSVIIVFISFGFRYRLIILLVAIGLFVIYSKGLSLKRTIKISIASFMIVLILVVWGNVRNYVKSIVRNTDSEATLVYVKDGAGPLDEVFKYTRNYIANMSLLKSLDQGYSEHDFGESMIGHVFIRAIPGFFFDGGKPFPPSLKASAESWHSYQGLDAGEAFSYVMDFYFAFGVPGVVIFGVATGSILFLISRRRSSLYDVIFISVTTASLFHFFTRGYLPGYLMSFIYIYIPLLFFKFTKGVR